MSLKLRILCLLTVFKCNLIEPFSLHVRLFRITLFDTLQLSCLLVVRSSLTLYCHAHAFMLPNFLPHKLPYTIISSLLLSSNVAH